MNTIVRFKQPGPAAPFSQYGQPGFQSGLEPEFADGLSLLDEEADDAMPEGRERLSDSPPSQRAAL
jgi:hypothetical protein